ncbi:glucose-6-phosphate isomerase [Thalassotalea sp. LPB0316]|uniref:glucose-6-phosphate isomerase n=1 Tax=Thalassotalea sp. LPB0316 TaxID=2769490 RepID=UPI001868CF01|nr:glucose-6-phosphate isomerase [Thalassotalea sp. LPB0316]QOL27244.1 glucose-6-phosphate isomerase [Thalassotalea sp. LPB0316]
MDARQSLPAWQALTQHANMMKTKHMKDLFSQDTERFNKYSVKLPKILFDYSKNLIDQQTITQLVELAKQCQVEQWRERMFAGEHINTTEDRAVLHVALRDRLDNAKELDGVDINQQIAATQQQMAAFCDCVRSGQWRGYSGKAITDVVSIGVGGSNLGPQMVTEALHQYSDGQLKMHYVSNVDGTQIANVLKPLNPETVLFIVSSKTFTTTETMTNAHTAMQWLTTAAQDTSIVAKHFVAVTANKSNAIKFGISQDNIFNMWDWVGGRFSLWSAIGLPIALDLGFDQFKQLLDGAYEVDQHFLTAELEQNIPVLMALMSLWNTTFLGAQSQAILPYDQSLHMLSAYLQQAEMESNGKSVNWQGEKVDYPTVPSIWGELGINGQHAFYQYLHQSNNIVPADFIGSVESVTPVEGHHETLMANFFAQTQALMQGVTEQEVRADLKMRGRSDDYINKVAPHKVHLGNRPTNTLLMKRISPRSIGNLIALYEHKIFVQGIILQICSFDQWGVELGKTLANKIQQELESGQVNPNHDSSTQGLLAHYHAMKSES